MLEGMTEKDFYKWLGEQCRIVREKKGMKQVEAAKVVGITSGELSNFENKGRKLSAYRVTLLLKAIGVSMDELIGEMGEKKTLSLSMSVS